VNGDRHADGFERKDPPPRMRSIRDSRRPGTPSGDEHCNASRYVGRGRRTVARGWGESVELQLRPEKRDLEFVPGPHGSSLRYVAPCVLDAGRNRGPAYRADDGGARYHVVAVWTVAGSPRNGWGWGRRWGIDPSPRGWPTDCRPVCGVSRSRRALRCRERTRARRRTRRNRRPASAAEQDALWSESSAAWTGEHSPGNYMRDLTVHTRSATTFGSVDNAGSRPLRGSCRCAAGAEDLHSQSPPRGADSVVRRRRADESRRGGPDFLSSRYFGGLHRGPVGAVGGRRGGPRRRSNSGTRGGDRPGTAPGIRSPLREHTARPRQPGISRSGRDVWPPTPAAIPRGHRRVPRRERRPDRPRPDSPSPVGIATTR
jgi:hypothetical protein